MRFHHIGRFLLAGLVLISFFSCQKKTEELNLEPVSTYVPLVVGKYITYRVDSTVFTAFGRTTEVHSYQVKHQVDQLLTDNLGRPSYRIYRFIRDLAGTEPWRASGSYMITPLEQRIEVIEDNLRFVKLQAPVREGFYWRGNSYLPDEPYGSLYNFSNDDFMYQWDYSYENLNSTFQYNSQTLTDVLEVLHVDERILMDTVDVISNKGTIPKNASAVYLRGTATDTIRLTAVTPDPSFRKMVIYNQSNYIATLNGIKIPAGKGFAFEYADNRWYYENPLTVVNNRVTVPRIAYTTFILGTATDSVKVDVSQLDTIAVKRIDIFNKSTHDAYCNFNPTLSLIAIPPNHGRSYELINGSWRLYNNNPTPLDKDPYIDGLAFGNTSYSTEKYAKNLGLVYREFILWEYQPNTGGIGGPYTTGFGIVMRMIDHN